MKKSLLNAAYVLIAIVIIFMGGAYGLPDEAVVERKITVAATPDKIFAIIGDLRRFNEYSPWADLDPGARITFEGPQTGIGQKMSWVSANPQMGSGSQTVVDHEPDRRFATTLNFGGMGDAIIYIELSPVANGTSVTWGFKTLLRNPLERWMIFFYDRTVGPDIEKGLARLKAVAEK